MAYQEEVTKKITDLDTVFSPVFRVTGKSVFQTGEAALG